MGHHLPASLPPILIAPPKLEKSRWRPRVRTTGAGMTRDVDDIETPHAVEARTPPASARETRRGDHSGFTDDTLRGLLVAQEALSGDPVQNAD